MLGRQAKVIANGDFKRLLDHVSRSRNPERYPDAEEAVIAAFRSVEMQSGLIEHAAA